MPSSQRGQVYKPRNRPSWMIRYYDADGARQSEGGFRTRRDAAEALERALRQVRLGPNVRRDLTVQELIDEFLAQHTGEQNTVATLRARLRYATNAFGDTRLERLNVPQLA